MIEFRPYQRQLRDDLREAFRAGWRRVLAVSPTGSGKTVLFALTAKASASAGNRVIVAVHRQEILEQISRTLSDVGLAHGIVSAGSRGSTQPVIVASVQTLARRLDVVPEPGLLVIDEAHHSVSGQYMEVLAKWNSARVLGVTATPERLDGRGLGTVFDSMVLGPSTAWLIENGFLARPVYYAPTTGPDLTGVRKVGGDYSRSATAEILDKPSITGDAVAHYLRLTPGQPAVAFCISVEHAKHVSERFNDMGVPSASIDGAMDPASRKAVVESLRTGKIRVMTSCELVSEGFDLPAVKAAILLRPTASLSMHLQQVGRALRPSPGKRDAIILDHVGNCLRHGLAEDDREWSLDGRAMREKREVAVQVTQCPKCFNVFRGQSCGRCGEAKKPDPRKVEEQDGELQRLCIEDLARRQEQKREEWGCKTLADWQALGRKRGHKPGWAYFRWKARGAKVENKGSATTISL